VSSAKYEIVQVLRAATSYNKMLENRDISKPPPQDFTWVGPVPVTSKRKTAYMIQNFKIIASNDHLFNFIYIYIYIKQILASSS